MSIEIIKKSVFLFASLLASSCVLAQIPIVLSNPSFEDFRRPSDPPQSWYDCGMPNETPPDVQPGSFEVMTPPNNGNSYLGLVTRDNDTWESVAQRLRVPIEGNQCYTFSIHLTHSDQYFSYSRSSEKNEFFVKPVKLRIWGGNGYCDKRELLGESALVSHTHWKEYSFKFEPKQSHKYILLEAFYKTPTLFPYNGNLLVDDASEIIPIPCDEEEPLIASVDDDKNDRVNVKPKKDGTPEENPKVKNNPDDNNVVVVTPDPTPKEDFKDPVIITELADPDKIRKDQIIEIKSLNFEVDSFRITDDNFDVLDELYGFLKQNKKTKIEIGGHTNNLCDTDFCNSLSEKRAKAVYDYLRKKGISKSQLSYKGYGKTKPIASNKYMYGRKKNQRVEVKILSTG